jgi:hypothetical protein
MEMSVGIAIAVAFGLGLVPFALWTWWIVRSEHKTARVTERRA